MNGTGDGRPLLHRVAALDSRLNEQEKAHAVLSERIAALESAVGIGPSIENVRHAGDYREYDAGFGPAKVHSLPYDQPMQFAGGGIPGMPADQAFRNGDGLRGLSTDHCDDAMAGLESRLAVLERERQALQRQNTPAES